MLYIRGYPLELEKSVLPRCICSPNPLFPTHPSHFSVILDVAHPHYTVSRGYGPEVRTSLNHHRPIALESITDETRRPENYHCEENPTAQAQDKGIIQVI